MSTVALIIIYNHKYDQNIPVLETLYGERFSNIYHLVPFYTGTKPNVIPVYENSFYFQGYVSQGLINYYKSEYKHYLFIADDMILNPIINEHNYTDHFKLNGEACFFPGYHILHELNKGPKRWERVVEAFQYKPNNIFGVESSKEIPNYEEAVKLFANHGLLVLPLKYDQINTPLPKPKWTEFKKKKIYYIEQLRRRKYSNKLFQNYYPLVGGYSDIFVISSGVIKTFAHYCGVFATGKLFVEFAIPTALVLAAEIIVTEKELHFQGMPLWTKEELALLDKYDHKIEKLLENFPKEFLY